MRSSGSIGRESIELYAPQHAVSHDTGGLLILKDPANEDLLGSYRRAETGERRRLLAEAAALPLPAATVFAGRVPMAVDIEWFFTTCELCALMAQVQDLPVTQINPGVASPNQWERVSYKGGSETGVLSLVTGLKALDGREFCVAAVWNDQAALDETAFIGMYAGLIEALATGATVHLITSTGRST